MRLPVFRLLWVTWFVANTTMWMNDVAAAWLMTSLAPSPLWVALVQAASTLPVFLLGLPSGALADIVDRRRYLLITQLWLACSALVLCLVVFMDWMTAPILLALTFANGVGFAMRWPVFAALMPEVLPRPMLAQGLALNGMAMNGSRIVGPLVAGALIASVGSAWVFALNAVMSLVAAYAIVHWRREHKESPLGREKLGSAIRVGMQFVGQSRRMQGVLLRIGVFFFHSTAVLALLPLIAKGLPGGDAGSFTLLLSALGAGAVLAVTLMPRIRRITQPQRLIFTGSVIYAVAAAAAVLTHHLWLTVPALFVCGMAWISVANTNSFAAQMALPDWVRARGMSFYQMAIMGSTAIGAAMWGQIATWASIEVAVVTASVTSVVLMALAQQLMPDRGTEEDLTPTNVLKVPDIPAPPDGGKVQIQIEYLIDPAQAKAFLAVMEATRASRLRQGALEWQLLHDLTEPGRYIEQVLDESWTEHLRRFDRISASDAQLREQRLALHQSQEPPRVTRYVIEKH